MLGLQPLVNHRRCFIHTILFSSVYKNFKRSFKNRKCNLSLDCNERLNLSNQSWSYSYETYYIMVHMHTSSKMRLPALTSSPPFPITQKFYFLAIVYSLYLSPQNVWLSLGERSNYTNILPFLFCATLLWGDPFVGHPGSYPPCHCGGADCYTKTVQNIRRWKQWIVTLRSCKLPIHHRLWEIRSRPRHAFCRDSCSHTEKSVEDMV